MEFHGEKDLKSPVRLYITEDEIDDVLFSGGNTSLSKYRIYFYFLGNHTLKEQADFLKGEYSRVSFAAPTLSPA